MSDVITGEPLQQSLSQFARVASQSVTLYAGRGAVPDNSPLYSVQDNFGSRAAANSLTSGHADDYHAKAVVGSPFGMFS